MTLVTLILAVYISILGIATSEVRVGKATHFSPLLMDEVYDYRVGVGDVEPCPECVGNVALLNKEDIGKRAWIVYKGNVIGPLLVIDCAKAGDIKKLVREKWVIDLSYEIAEDLGLTWRTAIMTIVLEKEVRYGRKALD